MPGLGVLELFVLFLMVLLFFGPKELPKIAKALARLIYEMKRVFQRLKKEWNLISEEEEKKEKQRRDIC